MYCLNRCEQNNSNSLYFKINNAYLSIVSLTLALVTTAALLYFFNFGFDFTDEGFYLNSIDNPAIYQFSITQFGFIYNPIYTWSGKDIPNLRQINLLVTLLLSFFVSYTSLSKKHFNSSTSIYRLILAFSIGTTSFSIYNFWLPTPNYNSLTLQSFLLCATGILLCLNNSRLKQLNGAVCISLGGVLSFLAKPSSAAGLAILVMLLLTFAKIKNKRLLVLEIFVLTAAITLAASLYIDNTPLAFYERIKGGMEYSNLLGGGHSVNNLIRFDYAPIEPNHWLLFLTLVLFSVTLYAFGNFLPKYYFIFTTSTITLLAAITIYYVLFNEIGAWPKISIYLTLYFTLTCFLNYLYQIIKKENQEKNQIVLFIIFILLPYSYALGTSNNYWFTAGFSAIFWIIAGIIILKPTGKSITLSHTLLGTIIIQLLLILTLYQAIGEPYRQPEALWANDAKVSIANTDSLRVPSSYAAHFRNLDKITNQIDLKPRTPIIDLSGQNPGLLYVLNSVSVGHPWLLGGYEGSEKLATAGILNTSCETLANSWVLTEPRGPRNISVSVLHSFGAELATDYKRVASWHSPKGAGGYTEEYLQILYQPINPNQIYKKCHKINR